MTGKHTPTPWRTFNGRTDLGRYPGSAMSRILATQHRTIEHGRLGLVLLGIITIAIIFGLGAQAAPVAV